jgi:hypothetical protein
MKTKLVRPLAIMILVLLPFLVGTALGNYTPYVEGNSFSTYVIIWAVISIVFTSSTVLFLKYSWQSNENILLGGIFLFLLLCPILGIIGLVEPPDLSLKMLDHPEREHLRYIFLFIATILFGVFAFFLMKGNSLQIKKSAKWIIVLFLILALIEFSFEFTHHYLYPEALKEWVSQGKNVEDFGKNYDSSTIVIIGVTGRFIQFTLLIWLSLHLYNLGKTKIWSPFLIIFFSLVGIVSSTVILIYGFNFPNGFEFLMLFFIPGIPFILLYWFGVALLTKFEKSKIANQKTTTHRVIV